MTRRRIPSLPLLALALYWPFAVAWLNPYRDQVAEANQLLKSGKYKEAISKYGEELVDNPESPLLNYNMGNANYRAGKFSEALASYTRVRTAEDDPKRSARTAYNAGNAQFRMAAALEKDKPQDALKGYAQALVAYRRAIGSDSSDQDAKFNYELAVKRIEDLQKKLQEEKDKKKEEEKQKQDQQQQSQQDQQKDQPKDQQQDQQQPQNQQDANQSQEPKDDQKQQQQGGDQQQQDQQPDQQQQQAQQQQQQDDSQQQAQQQQGAPSEEESQGGEQQQAEGEAGGKESKDGERREAAALLDSAKNEELRPDEFARRAQGAAVAEPAQDW